MVARTEKGRKDNDGGSHFRWGDRPLSEEVAFEERGEGRQDLGSTTEAAGSPAAETPEGLGLGLPVQGSRKLGWLQSRDGGSAGGPKGACTVTPLFSFSFSFLFPFLFIYLFGQNQMFCSKDLH